MHSIPSLPLSPSLFLSLSLVAISARQLRSEKFSASLSLLLAGISRIVRASVTRKERRRREREEEEEREKKEEEERERAAMALK